MTLLFVISIILPFIGTSAGKTTSRDDNRSSQLDWPSPWHDSQNSNYLYARSAHYANPIWEKKLGDINATSAVIAGNEIYVGTPNKILISFNLTAGRERWNISNGLAFNTLSPIVGDTFVYSLQEHTLFAYYRSNGTLAWRIDGFNKPIQPMISSLGLVIVDFSQIRIYGLMNGNLIRTIPFDNFVEKGCAIDGNKLFIYNSTITGFDLTTGAVIWSAPHTTNYRIVIVTGHLLIEENNYLVSLNEINGDVEWRYSIGTYFEISSDGSSIFLTNQSSILSLDAKKGTVNWETAISNGLSSIGNTVVVRDDRLYMETLYVALRNETDSSKGKIWAIDAETGELRWKYTLSNDYLWTMSAATNYLVLVNKFIKVVGNTNTNTIGPVVLPYSYGNANTPSSGNLSIPGRARDSDIYGIPMNESSGKGIVMLDLIVKKDNNLPILYFDQMFYEPPNSSFSFDWIIDTTKLPNLDPQVDHSRYKATITAYDADGFSEFSEYNFTVKNSGNQPVVPTYSINYPVSGEILNGTIMIKGSSPIGWTTSLTIDGGPDENITITSTKNDWEFQWDTTEFVNGTHTLYAVPGSGPHFTYYKTAKVTVNIFNPRPFISLSLPKDQDGDYLLDAGEKVKFNPPVISLFDNTTSTYQWSFGDKSTSHDSSPEHSFRKSGLYIVKLELINGTNSINLQTNIKVSKPKEPIGTTHVSTTTITGIALVSLTVIIGVIILANTEIMMCGMLPFMVGLYSRITKNEVLDHYTRGRIMGYLQANPGEHYLSIKEELDLNNGSLAYHLKVLEREGYIKSTRDGIYKRFYPMKTKVQRPISLEEQVLGTLRRSPGINQKEIAAKVSNNHATVHRILHKMEKAGIVKIIRDGREMRCYLAEEFNEGLGV